MAEALTTYRDASAPHRGPTADRVWVGDRGEVVLLGIGEVLYRDDTVSMSGPPSSELLWHIPPESFLGSLRATGESDAESTPTMRLRTRPQGTLQGRTLEDDPRAEVYTLGCLAYHALNGHHPFFTSLDDPTDDTYPRRIRVTLVAEETGQAARTGFLMGDISPDSSYAVSQ